jgi:hypothetical protein
MSSMLGKSRRRQRYRIAVTTQAGVNPKHMNNRVIGLGCHLMFPPKRHSEFRSLAPHPLNRHSGVNEYDIARNGIH